MDGQRQNMTNGHLEGGECPQHPGPKPPSRPLPLRIIALALLGMLALASCVAVSRLKVAPPSIPGAEFAGNESCESCHESQTRDFHTATHALVKTEWSEVGNIGCELCHGPASTHVESGGAFHTIVNPKRSPEVCFNCHQDLRGRFALPHHHPLETGELSCSDCHNSHHGPALAHGHGAAASLLGVNDGCVQCHPAQRGPFAFEHEAMREGCVVCHNPHGSVNNKMLTERNANLCLKCHADVRTRNILVGGLPHEFLMRRGTCWTAGCHEAVHGSHISTSLRY